MAINRRILSFIITAALIATIIVVVLIGRHHTADSSGGQATQAGSSKDVEVFFNPATVTAVHNGMLTVEVHENSYAEPVNAVEAVIEYPSDALAFDSTSANTSKFTVQAEASHTDKTVTLARGSMAGLTGDQLVATVQFKVLKASGSAQLTFGTGTELLSHDTNNNVLVKRLPAAITFSN